MSFTAEQLSEILYSHWRLLWPLPAAERAKMINELKLDYLFEHQLSLVSKEMEEPMRRPDPVEIVAVAIPVLAEAIAVAFSIGVVAIWLIIFKTGGIG